MVYYDFANVVFQTDQILINLDVRSQEAEEDDPLSKKGINVISYLFMHIKRQLP